MLEKRQLSMAEARAILRYAGESSDVDALIPIRAGAIGSIYEIHRERAPDLVVKIYPDAVADRMRTEAYVYRMLAADNAIPTPRVVVAGSSRDVLSASYLLMTRLEGKRLADIRDELPADELVAIYRDMARVLRHIHAYRFAECGPIIAGAVVPVGGNADFVRRQFADRLCDFESLGPPSLREALRAYVESALPIVETDAGGALCHNDYIDGNIIVAEQGAGWRVTGVVDVERAVVADPVFDLARISRARTSSSRAFVDAYGEVDHGRLGLYELYHVVELWNWFAQTGWQEQLPALQDEILRRVSVGRP